MDDVRLWAARGALVLIAAGTAFALWLVRIHTENAIWPVGHHPRLLAFLAVVLGWVGLMAGAAFVVGVVLVVLVREASR